MWQVLSMKRFRLLLPFFVLMMVGCAKQPAAVERPSFSGDSAYAYVARQMAFGPRVPNSQAHLDCAVWLIQQLRSCGAEVDLQKGTVTNYAGRDQQVMNIIAHFPSRTAKAAAPLLLCAHYDTRPWCDEEELYEDRAYNVPGANDGASGVGVLLEVARQLSMDSTHQSIDIVFFDCEDMGTPRSYTGIQRENTWCLGSQLFATHNVTKYRYGILLDMVGSPDAIFPREYYSIQYAENYQELIWRAARKLGYSRYFVDNTAYPIMDDHYYLNLVGIPCVDIIHYDAKTATGFASWWHTREDDMRNISTATLQAVGEVVMEVVK